jgi:hypothetical protein
MIAKLVQNLVHLECRGDGFDQYGGTDGARWDADILLGEQKHIVPKASLIMVLELGQVEVRSGAGCDLCLGVMKKEQSEIK